MEFKHLKEVLERYGDLLCTRYQTYAPEASGRLVQSARYEVRLGDRVYEVGLRGEGQEGREVPSHRQDKGMDKGEARDPETS